MAMVREEFEDWLEDHREEALDRIEADRLPLARWVSLYAKVLAIEVRSGDGSTEEIEDEDELDRIGSEEEDD